MKKTPTGVAALSETDLKGPEKTAALADLLQTLMESVATHSGHKLRVADEGANSIVAAVRSAKKFGDGIIAAQPIVEEAARVASAVLSELKSAQGLAAEAVSSEIEAEHEAVIRYSSALK